MLFSSTIFLFLFLPLVIFIYYVCLRKRTPRNVFLVFASLVFYAWGEPWFVFVMIASILANYGFALLIDRFLRGSRTTAVEAADDASDLPGEGSAVATIRRVRPAAVATGDRTAANLVVALMLVYNLSIIFVFKYLMFTLDNLNALFHAHVPIPAIMLPIGISFFTFQAISYVLDIYRGVGQVQRNPLNVGLYIALFPQLIAGPIVRYETIAEQVEHRRENFDDFSAGVCRFIFGLAKKVLIANNMALVADKAFALPASELSVAMAWLGILAYTFQIFFDFSGYSDMAIGLGKMFGFHFLENFNYPYIARSVTEFWRRWHISLSTWFRDYVYFPMGGSRVSSTARLVCNLFVVWLLTGLWHGANWTFICWGLFYFALLVVEKLSGYAQRAGQPSAWAFGRHAYLLLAVIIGWVLFRSASIGQAVAYTGTMFNVFSGNLIDGTAVQYLFEYAAFFLAAIIFSIPAAEWISSRVRATRAVVIAYPAVAMLLLVLCVSYMVKGSYNPFIYFNF